MTTPNDTNTIDREAVAAKLDEARALVERGWKPVVSAPYQRVLEVRNEQMDEPCLATRGYVYNGAVHPNTTFFTTVYTPHRFFPTPAGQLCCPTEWRLLSVEQVQA